MKALIEADGIVEQVLNVVAPGQPVSRRRVLKLCGATIAGMASWHFLGMGGGISAPLIITEQAGGLVVADPTRCVGCRRCELACTEFNDGKSSPGTARIKVRRNLNFGPAGLYTGQCTDGNWGSGLIVQDFCKQCPHPVPCADACPNAAIEVKPPVNVRVVNPDRCTGCKVCLKACPWEMISFDPETNKATKCFFCDGKPKCVEACPAEALMFVSWVDLTGKVPPRTTPVSNQSVACIDCHK
ncbi:MAG TPA: 4Fe-4S dicluster domain-containing protein [Syntrophobacter fumaroxidans]|nr:4Fe-4S dicluster domain-containing protein [Syntrophobacter fumaroxidans]